MFWAGLILTLLGAAAQRRQNKKASERRISEIRKGREKQQAIEEAQREDVTKEGKKYDPTARQEALDAKAAETEARIKAVLEDNPQTSTGDVGVISKDLLAQRAQSTRDRANNASMLAALLSKVQAPEYAGLEESRSMADLTGRSRQRGMEHQQVGATADILGRLRGTPSPDAMLMSGLAQSFGTSLASQGIMNKLQSPGASQPATGSMSRNPNYIDWSKQSWINE